MARMRSHLPYAAYLRVYEPLSAFPEPERSRWAAYVEAEAAPGQVSGLAREHALGLAALLAVPPLAVPPEDADQAFVRVRSGAVHVCPWRVQVRSWLALAEFRSGLPEELVAAFVPLGVADDAERDLERWVSRHPDRHVHIRTSTWHVPLSWFCLVDQAERELVAGGAAAAPTRGRGAGSRSEPAVESGNEAGGEAGADAGPEPAGTEALSCRFLTTMAQARRRAARALAALRKAYADGPLVGRVEDVARWLEEFHPHAMVELDYGGLAELLGDERLRGDESAALVGAAVRALADGDTDRAGSLSEQVTDWWQPLRALESAN